MLWLVVVLFNKVSSTHKRWSQQARSSACGAQALRIPPDGVSTPPTRAIAVQKPDARYGCGYRNIQVLLSFLLRQGPPFAQRVFSGQGVPTVVALQRAIELSWRGGFDTAGAQQLVRSADLPSSVQVTADSCVAVNVL
jgi:Peptidase family C78